MRTVGAPRSVLVVGAGFLGANIARGFVRRGVATTVLSRNARRDPTAARVAGASTVAGDANDLETLRAALADSEHVVWAAGGLMPAESNERPVDDVIATLPPLLLMLNLLAVRGDGALTFLSSGGTVYGNPTVLPVPEHHLHQPLSSHGVGKVASELYLSLYAQVHGVDTMALRCANVYGEGQQPHRSQGVVATALACVARGEPVPLFDEGSAIRDFIHVDDVVEVVCTLAGRLNRPTAVNVGSGIGTSVASLLEIIAEVTGRPVITTPRPTRLGDVRSVVLDITLLRSLMAFTPLSLPEGLARTWYGFEGASQLTAQ